MVCIGRHIYDLHLEDIWQTHRENEASCISQALRELDVTTLPPCHVPPPRSHQSKSKGGYSERPSTKNKLAYGCNHGSQGKPQRRERPLMLKRVKNYHNDEGEERNV
jgi:hypothetical protein